MSGHSSGEWLLLFCTALVVLFRAFALVRTFWNYPLNHGPGFFLGVEVAPGFYAGEGVTWLKRYRTVLVVQHLVEALALGAILVSGRWGLLPLWAGGAVVFAVAILHALIRYTRATLGANPPVQSSMAVSLEARRLGDYISWSAEVLMAAVVSLCWALLLTHGNAQVHWNDPVVMTYMIVGVLPCKIGVIRSSFPLPSERTAEHYQWVEAQRRHSLRGMDSMRWFFMVIFAGYALQHSWAVANSIVWLHWLIIGIALAVFLAMMGIVIRGSGRLAAMGRELRPAVSWSGSSSSARLMMPGFSRWSAIWLGGLVLLLVFFRR
jgi:hypothetical protein